MKKKSIEKTNRKVLFFQTSNFLLCDFFPIYSKKIKNIKNQGNDIQYSVCTIHIKGSTSDPFILLLCVCVCDEIK